jgi:hypothetical protein
MKQNRVPANLMGALLLSATLAACGGTPSSVIPAPSGTPSAIGTPSGEAVRVSVGPEGGTVRSADGKLRLTIPAGALSAATEISVQPITRTTPNGVGGAYRLEPEGVTFKQDVQLTFAYDDAQESAASAFVIASQDKRGVWQAHLNTSQDREANTLTVSTNHFSDWSWAEAYKLDPQQAAVKVGQSVRLNLMRCVGPDTPFDEETPSRP